MYFHSSGSRRDHYATLRNQHQLFKQQQLQRRSSTSSTIISGTDSGYQSPTLSHCNKNDQHQNGTKQDQHDNASTTSSIMTNSTTSTKQRKRKANKHLDYLHPRQPDLVYSSPRPLAFPFHNDCHFLPVAEADPRDIARIAPPPPPFERKPNNNKTASLNSSSYHRPSITSIPEDDTTSHTTKQSRPTSVNSSVQQGTVRSLRSFFQTGEQHIHRPVTSDHRILALEPKTGTVASLRKLFSRPSDHHADQEAETAIHTAKNSQSGNRIKTLFIGSQPRNRFTLSRLSTTISKIIDNSPKPPSAPRKRTQPSSLSAGFKRLFTRPSVEGSSSVTNAPAPRPIFASFSRAAQKDIDPTAPPKQHTIINYSLASSPLPPTTRVGRIWKNLKRLVNGNKVSRIGVL